MTRPHRLFRIGIMFVVVPGWILGATQNGTVTLSGAGSTFIYPILAKWAAEYHKLHPEVQIAYEPVGSGKGIARTLMGTVDFGASDGPISDAQLKKTERKILHVPVALGAVVPAYNLPGIKTELKFSPAALAGIFLGKITRWNDAELMRTNPGVPLPANPISVVYRLDGSGTTYVWTDYLSKVSAEWSSQPGRGTSVRFPVGAGIQYNEGVRDVIKDHPYSIGYLELTYAIQGRLPYGLVQNTSGVFVRATSESITAAASAMASSLPDDFRASITNGPAAESYPIASFTWLLVPVAHEDTSKTKALMGFVRWVLTSGQPFAAPLNYSPLPTSVASRALRAIEKVQP